MGKLIESYVLPFYKPDDIVTISEKIVSLCQKQVVYKKDMTLSPLAKFLSKFASTSSTGIGVNCVWKMQVAIDLCGACKVIWAAICGGICKIFGKKGVFYDIVGDEIRGLDGFYGNAFPEYENYGILLPKEPKQVCDQLCREYGISAAIVDVNDITCDILGIGWAAPYSAQQLTEIIRDNPSGQSDSRHLLLSYEKIKIQRIYHGKTHDKANEEKRTVRIILITVIALAILAVAVIYLRKQVTNQVNAGNADELKTATVSRGSITTVISGSGNLTDEDVEVLAFHSGVEVDDILVKAGQSVAQGDLLATVNMSTVLSAMADVQTQLNDLDDEIGEATGVSDGTNVQILSGLSQGETVYYSYADSIIYK